MNLPKPTKQSKLTHKQRDLLYNYGGLIGNKHWAAKFGVSAKVICRFKRAYKVVTECDNRKRLGGVVEFFDQYDVGHFPHQFKNKIELHQIIKKHQKLSYITYYKVIFNT